MKRQGFWESACRETNEGRQMKRQERQRFPRARKWIHAVSFRDRNPDYDGDCHRTVDEANLTFEAPEHIRLSYTHHEPSAYQKCLNEQGEVLTLTDPILSP